MNSVEDICPPFVDFRKGAERACRLQLFKLKSSDPCRYGQILAMGRGTTMDGTRPDGVQNLCVSYARLNSYTPYSPMIITQLGFKVPTPAFYLLDPKYYFHFGTGNMTRYGWVCSKSHFCESPSKCNHSKAPVWSKMVEPRKIRQAVLLPLQELKPRISAEVPQRVSLPEALKPSEAKAAPGHLARLLASPKGSQSRPCICGPKRQATRFVLLANLLLFRQCLLENCWDTMYE